MGIPDYPTPFGCIGHVWFMCPTSHCLQVGGRIHKSLLPEEEKHPITFLSNHPVVKLSIEDVHRRELHAGAEHTLSVL